MKRILQIIIIFQYLFNICNSSNSALLASPTDTWYYQTWEFETWENQAKHIKLFRDDGKILEHIIQITDSKLIWINQHKIAYTYNEDDLQTAITTLVWKDNNWQNSTKLDLVYYDNHLIKERNFRLFRNDGWENDVQFAYEYNESGNLLLETFSRWTFDLWEPYTKLIYKYDSLGLNYEILNTRFLDSVWVNYGLTLNDFDENNLLTKTTLFGWDINQKDWFFYEQNLYDYDNNKRMIEWINKQGDDGKWYDSFRETYEYTGFGGLYQKVKYRSVANQWRNSYRTTHYFDDKQDSIIILFEEWNNDSWNHKERRIREDLLSVYEPNTEFNIGYYPNPAKEKVFLDFRNNPFLFENYKVLYLNGETVLSGNLHYTSPSKAILDLSRLSNGFYILSLNAERVSKVIKILKIE